MAFQAPRGTADILPAESRKWRYVEDILHSLCRSFNYEEIRTPLFEHTDLFLRGVGETTDIVQKEMYTFADRGGRSLTLRPEGTAPVVRAYVEHRLYADPVQPVKLYYLGPMFRYERPQAGRQRQFTQFGVEAIGSDDPAVDAEVITLAWRLFERFQVRNLSLELNSVGCPVCRPLYREALVGYLIPRREELCKDCQSRLDRNPLRILDCKNDRCREIVKDAPSILDHLCGECREHFETLKGYLDDLHIPYELNPRLVRGLDYYRRTAFEIMEGSIGAKSTICGGGRYNGLVAEIGGPDQPGIGFGLGLERLLLTIGMQQIEFPLDDGLDFFVVAVGADPGRMRVAIVNRLREAGFRAETDYMDRKLKAQLRAADRLKAKYALILGDEELKKGRIGAKHLASGEQREISLQRLLEECKQLLNLNEATEAEKEADR